MPIYEYKCKTWGKVSEFFEGIGQSDIEKKCKYCGSRELDKMISRINVSSGNNIVSYQGGKTCCGRDERCEKPPCSDNVGCKRNNF